MDPLVIIKFIIIVILIILGWILYKNTRPTCTVSGSKCDPSLPCCKSSDGCYSNVCSDTCEYDTKKFLAFCKPDGTVPTCEEYAICEQKADKPYQSCNNWFVTNCNNWKPTPGPPIIVDKTATWTGEYFKINTLGGGGLSAAMPNIDLNTIDTLKLEIDFSSDYIHNNTGTFITIGLVTGMTVEDIHKKINSISVDISDSTIKLVQFSSPATNITTFPGALFPNYQVYLFDSTDLQKVPIVNLLLNTDTILTDKKLTFTIHFGGPVPPPSLPPAPFCPPNSVTDCFCGTYAGTKKCNKTGTIYGSCVYPYMGDVSSC